MKKIVHALLLNFGLYFVQASRFNSYKKLVDCAFKQLAKYKGHTVIGKSEKLHYM